VCGTSVAKGEVSRVIGRSDGLMVNGQTGLMVYLKYFFLA